MVFSVLDTSLFRRNFPSMFTTTRSPRIRSFRPCDRCNRGDLWENGSRKRKKTTTIDRMFNKIGWLYIYIYTCMYMNLIGSLSIIWSLSFWSFLRMNKIAQLLSAPSVYDGPPRSDIKLVTGPRRWFLWLSGGFRKPKKEDRVEQFMIIYDNLYVVFWIGFCQFLFLFVWAAIHPPSSPSSMHGLAEKLGQYLAGSLLRLDGPEKIIVYVIISIR